MVDLNVNLNGLSLKNPITTASGTYGYADEYDDFISVKNLGAIVTKAISLNPRPGNKGRRIMETEAGMINSQLEELAFQLIDRLRDEEVLSNKYNAVLDVNLDRHSIQYTDDKITIVLNGSNKYASDYFQESSASCAFVIEYDRNNQESQMRKQAFGDGYLHLQSDEVFYAR